MQFRPTSEQQAAISSTAKRLVIKAYAGCTKTTTLAWYAMARPRSRMLYIAFNSANAKDAASKFPPNVTCRTSHQVAMAAVGFRYSERELGYKKIGPPRPNQVAKLFGVSSAVGKIVLDTVNAYLCSADDEIGGHHVPASVMAARDIATMVKFANDAWAAMQDTGNRNVLMPHDGYLKLFQLSHPRLEYDVLLSDESQDINPTFLDILERQTHCGIVMVGDDHQNIYAFRGATNALSTFKADEELRLSCSFRFGAGIAAVASAILREWKGEATPLQGLGKIESSFAIDYSRPYAVIARSNGELFSSAIVALSSGRPFGFVGGIENYKFSLVLDAYHLWKGDRPKVRDKFIADFDSFAAMREYANESSDMEIKSLVNVVENHREAVPLLIERIKDRAVDKDHWTGKEILLMTAHKSKGLEFDQVLLRDDFADLARDSDKAPSVDEINLIYVAVTRARRAIQLNAKLLKWLEKAGLWNLVAHTAPQSAPELPYESAPVAPADPAKPEAKPWLRRAFVSLSSGEDLQADDRRKLQELLGTAPSLPTAAARPEPRAEEAPAEAAPDPIAYTVEFEAFWQIYPKKQGKKEAFEAWQTLVAKGGNIPIITLATRHYGDHVMRQFDSKFAHPASAFLKSHVDEWVNFVP